MKTLYIVAAGTTGLLAWEHVAYLNGWNIKPSVGITKASNVGIDNFKFLGGLVARGSSYLVYLRLGELLKSMKALLVPSIRLVVSPLYVFVGYIQQLQFYEKVKSGNSYLVIAGSALALGLLAYAAMRYWKVDIGKLWPKKLLKSKK